MLKVLLKRLTENSLFGNNATRRIRRSNRSKASRGVEAEVLETRQLLTLFVIDTLTDSADDANGVSNERVG